MSALQKLFQSESWSRPPMLEKAKDLIFTPHQSSSVGEAILIGLAAGVVGTVALNIANMVEQRLTDRPSSFVPAHTFQRLVGLEEKPDADSGPANAAFQWGIGALSGAMRGVMSQAGMRGPYATFIHLAARVCTDQSLENSVGMSTAPWTWPYDEQVLDMAHKSAYAIVTGLITDSLVYSSRAAASNRRS
jgi:hypothetical protein